MKTITKIEELVSASMKDVANWLARVELRTDYLPSTQGRQRRYTYANTVELSFVSAFTKAGLRPSSAVAYASLFTGHRYVPEGIRDYLVFADGDYSKAVGTDLSEAPNWLVQFPEASVITVIPVKAIFERINAYFDEFGSEDEG